MKMSEPQEKKAVVGMTPEQFATYVQQGRLIGPNPRRHRGLRGTFWSSETLQRKRDEQKLKQLQQAQQQKPIKPLSVKQQDMLLLRSLVGTRFNAKVKEQLKKLPLQRLLAIQQKLLKGKPTFKDTHRWRDEDYNLAINIINGFVLQKLATTQTKGKSLAEKLQRYLHL